MAQIPDDIFSVPANRSGSKGRIAIVTADGTEDQEFFYPYYRFSEAGYTVDVFTPDGKGFKGKNGAGLPKTKDIAEADPGTYDLLYIPGGKAPEALKKLKAAVSFVQDFHATGKPIGAVCHGPQLLAAAEIIEGAQIAAWPECQGEVEDAGATYVNQACVESGAFITGRWPADLPVQMEAILKRLSVKQAARPKAA